MVRHVGVFHAALDVIRPGAGPGVLAPFLSVGNDFCFESMGHEIYRCAGEIGALLAGLVRGVAAVACSFGDGAAAVEAALCGISIRKGWKRQRQILPCSRWDRFGIDLSRLYQGLRKLDGLSPRGTEYGV